VAARIALAAVATLVAAGFAVQLHAHSLLDSALTQIRAEVAGNADPRARAAATDDALRVADLRPGSGGLFAAIGLETRGERFAEAERHALKATRREPDNYSAWLTLGVVRQGRGDRAGASAAYARAAKLNPLYRTPR
jgi:Flp pilus assembly protein TadD